MKKRYSILLLLCAITFIGNAQTVTLPQAYLSASPLGTEEKIGNDTAGFSFSETTGIEVPAFALGLPNTTINVNLQYIQLKDADVNLITGSLLDYFTPSYNSDKNLLLFEQKSDIPANWFGSVEFPIDVIKNSNKSESYNGINVNITSIDKNTKSPGKASAFTYTDKSVLYVDDVEPLFFNVSPNPTYGVINIKLENNDDSKVELFDLLGKKILTKEYNNLENVSLNIKYLASAIYLLKVTSKNGATNSVKILKK